MSSTTAGNTISLQTSQTLLQSLLPDIVKVHGMLKEVERLEQFINTETIRGKWVSPVLFEYTAT